MDKEEGNSQTGFQSKSKGNDHKQKTKRRSRHEKEGRSYNCDCGKSYLSETALKNHKIQKHNLIISEKRGKGRPRKLVIIKITLAFRK